MMRCHDWLMQGASSRGLRGKEAGQQLAALVHCTRADLSFDLPFVDLLGSASATRRPSLRKRNVHSPTRVTHSCVSVCTPPSRRPCGQPGRLKSALPR
jgi:hypothetical protein